MALAIHIVSALLEGKSETLDFLLHKLDRLHDQIDTNPEPSDYEITQEIDDTRHKIARLDRRMPASRSRVSAFLRGLEADVKPNAKACGFSGVGYSGGGMHVVGGSGGLSRGGMGG